MAEGAAKRLIGSETAALVAATPFAAAAAGLWGLENLATRCDGLP